MLVTWVDVCQLSTLRIVKDAKEIHNRFIYLSHTPIHSRILLHPSFLYTIGCLTSTPTGIVTPELENRCRPRTYKLFLSLVYYLSFAHFPESWNLLAVLLVVYFDALKEPY
jgi:hypothetical protein